VWIVCWCLWSNMHQISQMWNLSFSKFVCKREVIVIRSILVHTWINIKWGGCVNLTSFTIFLVYNKGVRMMVILNKLFILVIFQSLLFHYLVIVILVEDQSCLFILFHLLIWSSFINLDDFFFWYDLNFALNQWYLLFLQRWYNVKCFGLRWLIISCCFRSSYLIS